MTPQEKLARVESLLAARAAITAELLELMGVVDAGEKQPEESIGVGGKKQRKCSVCGKPGHTAQSCVKNTPENFGLEVPAKKGCPECGSISRHKATCSRPPKKSAFPSCGECKKRGKHAKWCSRYAQVERAAKLKDEIEGGYGRPAAMSARQYERVKIANAHEVPADAIARELGLKLNEVNDEIISADYENYSR